MRIASLVLLTWILAACEPTGDAGTDAAADASVNLDANVIDAGELPDAWVPTDRGPLDPDAACDSATALSDLAPPGSPSEKRLPSICLITPGSTTSAAG